MNVSQDESKMQSDIVRVKRGRQPLWTLSSGNQINIVLEIFNIDKLSEEICDHQKPTFRPNKKQLLQKIAFFAYFGNIDGFMEV